MTKKTVLDIAALKSALKDLQDLNTQMSHTDSASSKLRDVTDVSQDFGPLIDNGGTQLAQYVNARTTAVGGALQQSGAGLQGAITMLQSTISNYETNEKTHKAAADATGTGGAHNSGPGAGRGRG